MPFFFQGGPMAESGYEEYAEAVQESMSVDPLPTVRGLSENSGIPPDDIIHHILVQWATSFSEARLAIGSLALRQLKEALEAEDYGTVKGIVSWLHLEV